MQVLFTTRTNNPVSKLIRSVLGEPVSHCALRIGEFVVHSDLLHGVYIEPYSQFSSKNDIVYSVEVDNIPGFYLFLHDTHGKFYDYTGFLMLGIRKILPKRWTKKRDVGQITGTYMCHELVNKGLSGEELTFLTPYKLYLNLSGEP